MIFCSYDVYTPTQNIVYHNYQANPDGHGPMEWLKPRFERYRQASLMRVRSYLELPNGLEGYNLANLGIYGLGKRRTLQQLAQFARIDLTTQSSRVESVRHDSTEVELYSEPRHSQLPSLPKLPCGDDEWVPYDSNISPVANLYDKPDDLDPQPEFPLRTEFTFYIGQEWEPPKLEILEGDVLGEDGTVTQAKQQDAATTEPSSYPSAFVLTVLWILGLCAWCSFFLRSGSSPTLRRKKSSSAKMVKDV